MEAVQCPVCGTQATVPIAGTMPKSWYTFYFIPGDSRCCSYGCLQTLKEIRMAVEWKRKKTFDGKTCGLKGCSRKASGYLADKRPSPSNKNGQLWYGPICEKCCLEYVDKKPDPLRHIWEQREGLEETARVLNISTEDAHTRLLEHVPGYAKIVDTEGETVPAAETPLPAPAAETMVITLPSKAVIFQKQEKAQDLLADVRVLQINNREDLEVAAEVIQHANALQKQLAEERKEAKSEPNRALARIDELYGPIANYLQEVEQTLKGKVANAQVYASQVQQQELQRAAQASQRGDTAMAHQAMQAAASEFELPPGLQSADVMDFEIINPIQVPRQYLAVDGKKIRAALKAGERNIPGVRIFKQVQIKVKKT